jgi:uncharacterized protein (TIGR00288 family)
MQNTNKVAVFIDFENIKRSADDCFIDERVELKRILEGVAEVTKGRIVLKKAYADWGMFKDYRSDLLDNATEAVQAFALTYGGKNGADIRIAIDVMEFALRQPDIHYIALVSGDSDFTPLVMKLREFGRHVIGVGVRSTASHYLAKSCDRFLYYDDLRNGAQEIQSPATDVPMDAGRLLAVAMAKLGNRSVPGSLLKQQMRKEDSLFDEQSIGYISFYEFLQAHDALVDVYKPAIGDITVAPKGQLKESLLVERVEESRGFHNAGYTPYVPSNGIPYQIPPPPSPLITGFDRYRIFLKDNNFRYVPSRDRRESIRAVYNIFAQAEERGETVSLKEAKDRLHQWFETNRPSVPWESINSTVYHLFYTRCFDFDQSEGNERLWDCPTTLQDVNSADELIARCERGIVQRTWQEYRSDLDIEALHTWLFDDDREMLSLVQEMVDAAPDLALAGRS